MKVAIIGGGAAGFFSAIQVKENYPNAEVFLFEKSQNILSKLKISGGGRCNVTNACDISELSKAYPRGNRFLKRTFYTFNNQDIMQWFESKGVPLVIQSDNCVFPKSQKSQSIIDLFTNETSRLKINTLLGMKANSIIPKDDKLEIHFENKQPLTFDKVIVTTGGSPKKGGFKWLENLNHTVQNPVPSLFTFNMPNESISKLMGVVVENTLVSIQGSKIETQGALLITHWGMSGPAIIKLSSYAARLLNEKDYNFNVKVNWINDKNNTNIQQKLLEIVQLHPHKMLSKIKPFALPERLWLFLLEKTNLSPQKKWNELGKKGINKLVQLFTNDLYTVQGKTTFKEEFVTCGGIDLNNINGNTMQSKLVKNLYFAGEVLDIDGITGGYNFQAAWTTGFIAGKLLD
ncbi:MAG TPA: NAD(P)/FAD-dependent oxidoreductase [Lutibacter sp.]|nr:NAD(P)/FAD-dependent oxidoreductase [Lutibacter sp.]